ncbi:MAG: sialate O-acetylesterase [Pirellulaceae bacterium]
MRCVIEYLFLIFTVSTSWIHAAELKLISPLDYQVVQRTTTGDGTLRIVGKLSEVAPPGAVVEGKLSDSSQSGTWTRLETRIVGHDISAMLDAPAGGWKKLEVRVSHGDSVLASATVEHVGIGEVFVIAGQSNSANHGEQRQSPKTDQVVAWDGIRWQVANDPQPGASGQQGSFAPAFGDAVVEKLNVPVGIVACGIGATSVREWLPVGSTFPNPPTLITRVEQTSDGRWTSKGEAFQLLTKRINELGPHGLRAVLWHQGESDANQQDPSRTLPGNLYRQYLEKIIRESRKAANWDVPWFVAQASYHAPEDETSPDIRDAQASLWTDGIAFEGPDTDALKGELRANSGQGVHFSAQGLQVHGEKWAEKVVPWINQSNSSKSDSQIRVHSDFEGGNAEVVRIDQDSQSIVIMPMLREGRGWPCWWSLRINGLRRETELTLEVQAQTKPYQGNKVLANAWCQPRHAWISHDEGKSWSPSAQGILNSSRMVYKIPITQSEIQVAWGPPFVASDAEQLLHRIAEQLPESKRFELSKTRGGRIVSGIRVGAENARHQVWVNARQHAWEVGGSQVGQGFIEWIASNDPAAEAMRKEACVYFVPIIDVDNVVLGAGGKDATPRDHNRDWSDQPYYPEIAAAQEMIRTIHAKHGLDVYVDLHNPGANDPTFFFGPFGYAEFQGNPRRNYQRWIEVAAKHIREPVPIVPEYRFATYVTTEEERGRMSSEWVRQRIGEDGISVTLETGWNNIAMSAAGYAEIGAGLGRTLAEYFK